MALESIAPGVWAAWMPHVFMGVQFGTRMTVVRLSDGSLFLHSPIALDHDLKAELDALGPVSHIVAPSTYHHLYVGEVAAAYPDAMTHGAPGLEKKRKDLAFDAWLDDGEDPGWEDEIDSLSVEALGLGETVFFHQPSRTLISADFIQNFDSSDHWVTRQYLKLAGLHNQVGFSRALRFMCRDKTKARRAVDRVIAWNPERITLAHGDPILADGQAAVRTAYAWLKG